jgi:hypothetical protein
MKRKTHAEVAEQKRCAGVAGHSACSLCHVPVQGTLSFREIIFSGRTARKCGNFRNFDLSFRARFSTNRMLTPSQA